MNEFFSYLLRVNAMVICLTLFYQLTISQLTFHYINRFFLLLAIPFSLIIPLLKLNWLIPLSSFGLDTFNDLQDSSSNVFVPANEIAILFHG